MIYVFADCELDEVRFELRRGGTPVSLEPKTFDVLAYFVRCPDRVVTKDELLDAVWPGQAVSESVLPKCVAAARRAVGDDAIRTVHGRGYRFVATVRSRASEAAAPPIAAGAAFVGRAHAMERLHAALASAIGGRGRLVLLVGEPGIGKTRTAEELGAEARRRGAAVVFARAHESEGAPSFWPWIQILRALVTPRPTAGAPRRRAAAMPTTALLRVLEGESAAAAALQPGDAQQARFRLFDDLTAALRAESDRQPLVIAIDDLHWADDASLRLLGFVAGELAAARLLIIGTYRDAELRRGHPLSELLGRLARQASCERLALQGFDRAETRALIAGIAEAVAEEVAAAVHEMTDGNPFFIQEVARLLGADAALARAPQTGLHLVLPQSVRDAVGRRLEALPPQCGALLRAASVLGREFTVPMLSRIAEPQDRADLEWLSDAVRARVLDETDVPGRYRFHHSLIRQTLYDELGTPERVRLHARAAEALEASCGGDTEPYLDELAFHCFEAAPAGAAERAIAYATRAAERSRRQLAYEQSARQYERALQLAEIHGCLDPVQRAELLLATAAAHVLAGARPIADKAFGRAAELGRGIGRVDVVARAALGLRGPGEMGTPLDAATLNLLETSLAALGAAEVALRARLLSRLTGTPPHSDSMERREALSSEALALARHAGDSVALRDALEARLWACLGPDRLDERLAVARELLALADAQQSRHMALLAHNVEFGAELVRGDVAAAERALAAFAHLAEELREPAPRFYATFYAGSGALARGDLDRAEQLFRAALVRGRESVPYAHFMCTAQLFVITYLRGGPEDPELERVLFGEMMALPYSWLPALRSSYAFTTYLRGDRAAAQREFAALMSEVKAIRRDEHWLVTMGALSTLAVLLGDREAAACLYDLLLPYDGLFMVHDLLRSITGTIGAALGNLATLLERFTVAEEHLARAAEQAAVIGGAMSAMERPGYALLLLTRAEAGDRDRAIALLAEVREAMARLGIRRSWHLTAIEGRGLLTQSVPVAGARRIPKQSSKIRQDSRTR
jgi:DNA-binding winged helix-turn-helix (wHTH) protein